MWNWALSPLSKKVVCSNPCSFSLCGVCMFGPSTNEQWRLHPLGDPSQPKISHDSLRLRDKQFFKEVIAVAREAKTYIFKNLSTQPKSYRFSIFNQLKNILVNSSVARLRLHNRVTRPISFRFRIRTRSSKGCGPWIETQPLRVSPVTCWWPAQCVPRLLPTVNWDWLLFPWWRWIDGVNLRVPSFCCCHWKTEVSVVWCKTRSHCLLLKFGLMLTIWMWDNSGLCPVWSPFWMKVSLPGAPLGHRTHIHCFQPCDVLNKDNWLN